MSIFDKVLEYAENAPEAGRTQLTYGKVTMTPYKLQFHGKGQKAERIPIGADDDLSGKVLELVFDVNIQEFNPSLEFGYQRGVTVQKSKIKGEQVVLATDWSEIVLPSLLAVFGEKWADKIDGSYVECEDVPSTRGSYEKDGVKKQLNTVKFLRKFANADDCLAARNETYGSKGEEGEVLEGAASQIPADVVGAAMSLRKGMGDENFKKTYAGQDPFNKYDLDALMTASLPL